MHFEVIDTATFKLWDFGWFDRSRFRFTGMGSSVSTSEDVLRAFIHSGLFPRRFCTHPDPWGGPVDHHGPFTVERLSPASYVRIAHHMISRHVDAVLNSPGFAGPPSPDQLAVLTEWLREIGAADADVFILERHHAQDALIDWQEIWLIFTEIVAVVPSRGELMIGVLGYD
jgi:hypothetical protein